ncbi:LLM class flavin-dependent oxidoreductase, partial [Actinomadura sp. LOL_011]|uniref:LLM class flavin-dependent oxidoreductase n=1 Tax=Actinomadura sp. LOL_011 TaxID=3345410 RepID=UPI003A7FA55E
MTPPQTVDRSIRDKTVDRSAARVLDSPNKLKLGLFGPNLQGGVGGVTLADGTITAGNWDEIKSIAVAADDATFEVLIPVARWKGFGGESRFWDRAMDTLIWGAGVAEATKNIQIFTTCHVQLFHPLMAARMGATIDHIANGRWGLNVVAGWIPQEFQMFGMPFDEHGARYKLADEWMRVVDRLWSESEPFTFEGDYYKLYDAVTEP